MPCSEMPLRWTVTPIAVHAAAFMRRAIMTRRLPLPPRPVQGEGDQDEPVAQPPHQPPGEGGGDEEADRCGREGEPGGERREVQADLQVEREGEEHRRVRHAEEESDEEAYHEGALP